TTLGNGNNVRAILTIPISRFKRSVGCCSAENSELLNDENIDKKFSLKILDPVCIGTVVYRGDGTKFIEKISAFPQPEKDNIYYLISRESKDWAVFEKKIGKTLHFIVIKVVDVDVKPLF
ncbi:MAG: hypothetical protein WC842_04080, partial [Candidatus Paceibacterota bacterium]